MSRLLAIDHGAARIGIAVGETETRMAFARPAIRRRGLASDLDEIEALARSEGAERVLLGLPLHMSGEEGEQAAAARAFGERLSARGLDVIYADERLTSWEAREQLRAAGRHPTRRGGEVDSAAARVFLQEYLDAHPDPPPPEFE